MDVIGRDLIEQTLIVGDQQRGVIRCGQLVHTASHDAQGIDVQAGIRFIEDGHHGVQQGHLENLIALLLSTGKPFIDAAFQEGGVHLDHLELLLNVVFKVEGVEFLQPLLAAAGVGRHAQELKVAHPGNLHRVLKTEEHPEASPLLRLQLKQIGAAVTHGARGHAIGGMASQHLGQGAFAAAVAAHHRMDLTGPHLQVHPFEDGLILNRGMQVGDVEKQLGVGADHWR